MGLEPAIFVASSSYWCRRSTHSSMPLQSLENGYIDRYYQIYLKQDIVIIILKATTFIVRENIFTNRRYHSVLWPKGHN